MTQSDGLYRRARSGKYFFYAVKFWSLLRLQLLVAQKLSAGHFEFDYIFAGFNTVFYLANEEFFCF